MADWAIQIENIGKQFRIGARIDRNRTLRDTIVESATAPLKKAWHLARGNAYAASNMREMIWALRDVSFEVQAGEVIGIIGPNGAGKSTLLKILSRITEPTEGQARVRGRLGSLLEVGTGFHPELTGRENIYLNGAILGMRKVEIECKFDEIVAFAEVEKFLETPVKHYSSGMYVRLAFAVAAHLEPEILLVDEVLAVGDLQFQKKCLGKMNEVTKQGRTVLFVSHNMLAIRSLCRSAILLDSGSVKSAGLAPDVIQFYLNEQTKDGQSELIWEDPQLAPGNEKARLQAVRLRNSAGQIVANAGIDEELILEVDYCVLASDAMLSVVLSVHNEEEIHVIASPSTTDKKWFLRPHPPGIYRSQCRIPPMLLNTGRHSASVQLLESGRKRVADAPRAIAWDMIDCAAVEEGYLGKIGGITRTLLQWQTEKKDELD